MISNGILTKLDPNHFQLEYKSKKIKIAILELKNPYEQIIGFTSKKHGNFDVNITFDII